MGTSILNYLTHIIPTSCSWLPWKKEPVCEICRLLDLKEALVTLKSTPVPRNERGIVVRCLPERPDPLSACQSCQLLSQVTLDPIPSQHGSPGYEIRVFPFLTTELINRHHGGFGGLNGLADNTAFIAVVPVGFNKAWEAGNQRRLWELVSERGYLLAQDTSDSAAQVITPRHISPWFDPEVVNTWLDCCHVNHGLCSRSARPISNLRLIDCTTSDIVCFDGNQMVKPPPYVSLSYVWGKSASNTRLPAVENGSKLPYAIPRVIEDAIRVTEALGFQYLWVDKYCIDQADDLKKHQQIHQMDLVYQNSSLTIITAGGDGEDWRLPGVVFGREWALLNEPQPSSARLGSITLSPIPPCPNNAIRESHWATRGWTYQEAFLSRRRLVFTSDQLYFECNSMHCNESLAINFPLLQTSTNDALLKQFIRPREFGMAQFSSSTSTSQLFPFSSSATATILSMPPCSSSSPLSSYHSSTGRRTRLFLQYISCVSQYTTRQLSFSRDSLNAFSGIISQFESLSPHPLRHMWGLPFFHRSGHSHTLEYAGTERFFLSAMCWHHPFFSGRHQRRPHFPSWSWAGWAGQAVWPDEWETEWIVDGSREGGGGGIGFRPTARNIRIKISGLNPYIYCHSEEKRLLDDIGNIYTLECLDYKATALQNQRIRHPEALLLDSYALPSSAYAYDEENGRLSVWGCNVALAMSPRTKSDRVWRYLVDGRYNAIELGSSGSNAYFLVVRLVSSGEGGASGDGCCGVTETGKEKAAARRPSTSSNRRRRKSFVGGIDVGMGAVKCTRVGLMIMSIFQPSSPGSPLSVGLEENAVRSYMLQ